MEDSYLQNVLKLCLDIVNDIDNGQKLPSTGHVKKINFVKESGALEHNEVEVGPHEQPCENNCAAERINLLHRNH